MRSNVQRHADILSTPAPSGPNYPIVNLPSMIAHTTMDSESIALLKEHLAEFLAFLVREQKRFFVSEYETPSTSYNRFAAT